MLGEEDQLWSSGTFFQFASLISAASSFATLHWGGIRSGFSFPFCPQIFMRCFLPQHDLYQAINPFVDRLSAQPTWSERQAERKDLFTFCFSISWFLSSIWYFFFFSSFSDSQSYVSSERSTIHLFWKNVLALIQKRLTNCNLYNLRTVSYDFYWEEGFAFSGVDKDKNQIQVLLKCV